MILTKHEDGENNEVRGNTKTEPKLHTIPRVVVNLENLFNLREKFKHPKNFKTNSSCPTYEFINLGTVDNPKNINLRKSLSPKEKKAYLKLFREYKDVFSWSYQDLKTYDTRIIQHIIPLILEVKSFEWKLRKFCWVCVILFSWVVVLCSASGNMSHI